MPKIKVTAWKCAHCNHVWLPRNTEDKPYRCANRDCRRTDWDEASFIQKSNTQTVENKQVENKQVENEPVKTIISKCPQCGGKLIIWGSLKRCLDCERNY